MLRRIYSCLKLVLLCIGGLFVLVECAPASVPNFPEAEPITALSFVFPEDNDPLYAQLPFVEDELLVQPLPGANTDDLSRTYNELGAEAMEELPEIQWVSLKVQPDRFVATADSLLRSGLIESVQKNYVFQAQEIPNDPEFPLQWFLASARVPEAWDLVGDESEVILAVVDTGVDATHPDLAAKLLSGWNTYQGTDDTQDHHGHGTAVAGVAAAITNNKVGVSGVARSSPVLPIRAADGSGKSTSRYAAAGILWAVEHQAQVINVSFAPLWGDQVVRSAAQQAFHRGALVVISAGNGGGTTKAAGYSEALFVGALTDQSEITTFSDRGPFLDLMAGGTSILTTQRGGGYNSLDGTSFAAPLVAGIAALAWSARPQVRPVSIVNALINGARDLGSPGHDGVYGWGAVDAARTLELLSNTETFVDHTPPELSVIRPAPGQVLSGRYTASVLASDESGIADVAAILDGIPFATDTRSPFQFLIDVKRFSSGVHELRFAAVDQAGHRATTHPIRVTFGSSSGTAAADPKGISFVAPTAGTSITGDVTIRATVSDTDGLAVVEWAVDGVPVFAAPLSGTTSGISYLWRTAGASRGRHSIAVSVTDTTGERTTARLELVIP